MFGSSAPARRVAGLAAALLLANLLPFGATAQQDQSGDTVDLTGLGFQEGAEDARVQVVEFSDFGCGFCKSFHDTVWPELQQTHITRGRIKWRFVPVVVGLDSQGNTGMFKNAVPGARAGLCAGDQEHFGEMRDRLFSDQSDWTLNEEPESVLMGFADEMGLDMDRFRACYSDDTTLEVIRRGTDAAAALGVTTTPTFWIVGLGPLPGVQPMTTWNTIVARIGGGGRP